MDGAFKGNEAGYLDALEERLRCSRDRDGYDSIPIRIAGHSIEIRTPRISGVQITRAFEHLPRHEERPEAVFEIFEASAEAPYLAPPPSKRGDKWLHLGLTNEDRAATFDVHSRLLNLYDRSAKRGIYYAESLSRLPYWEFGFPLRTLIHWWSQAESFQFVHGAAVVAPATDLAILMPGVGGSGKTTTSLLALKLGFGFLGDDYVIVKPGDPPQVFSAYSSAKLENSTLERHPWLSETIGLWGGRSEKHVAFLAGWMPDHPQTEATISAIVLPRVTNDRQTRISPASTSDCLRAIAPTTVTHLPLGAETMLQKIKRVSETCSAYRLDLGTDQDGVAAALLEIATL